jgi:hypothetical protein
VLDRFTKGAFGAWRHLSQCVGCVSTLPKDAGIAHNPSLHSAACLAARLMPACRYSWRSSAEFAKQAMHQQRLDGSKMAEVLDVRWANDDPNPRAVERVKREREEAFRDAYTQVRGRPETCRGARGMQGHMHADRGCSGAQCTALGCSSDGAAAHAAPFCK